MFCRVSVLGRGIWFCEGVSSGRWSVWPGVCGARGLVFFCGVFCFGLLVGLGALLGSVGVGLCSLVWCVFFSPCFFLCRRCVDKVKYLRRLRRLFAHSFFFLCF